MFDMAIPKPRRNENFDLLAHQFPIRVTKHCFDPVVYPTDPALLVNDDHGIGSKPKKRCQQVVASPRFFTVRQILSAYRISSCFGR
jgi:hypothetical protein